MYHVWFVRCTYGLDVLKYLSPFKTHITPLLKFGSTRWTAVMSRRSPPGSEHQSSSHRVNTCHQFVYLFLNHAAYCSIRHAKAVWTQAPCLHDVHVTSCYVLEILAQAVAQHITRQRTPWLATTLDTWQWNRAEMFPEQIQHQYTITSAWPPGLYWISFF